MYSDIHVKIIIQFDCKTAIYGQVVGGLHYQLWMVPMNNSVVGYLVTKDKHTLKPRTLLGFSSNQLTNLHLLTFNHDNITCTCMYIKFMFTVSHVHYSIRIHVSFVQYSTCTYMCHDIEPLPMHRWLLKISRRRHHCSLNSVSSSSPKMCQKN